MQLHQIKTKDKKKKTKRVGRGGKRGTYSGRGIKGQKSRAGRRIRPQLRDIIKRIPKKRGYRTPKIRKGPVTVNLEALEKKFEHNEKVTPKTLFKKGIIKMNKGFLPKVKLLGGGDLTKKLLVSECQISKPAEEKIKKAGGQINE
ncbi:50S ribosomal protein L15 [Patescibacteria group bacterium]|nr:50S ribosomal protein L15 [Patescibacteria group bacterium]MBU2219166.1 50S ribosomal protein L15 [Patescibacteria group bacterium]MBU2263207.1 50S ribosomal protein L15 [Patescibacteria group bacterium]